MNEFSLYDFRIYSKGWEIVEFKKSENETEFQFLWRLGSGKTNGTLDLSWKDIADIMNRECRTEQEGNYDESRYRKIYQAGEKLFNGQVFPTENQYLDEITQAKHELRKEKQKLFDERTALNKILRERGRAEEDLTNLAILIRENGKTTMPKIEPKNIKSDNDLIICLSDFHLGMEVDNFFGKYNSEIAYKRLQEYLTKILEIQKLYNAENAFIVLLGDLLSGQIHFTTQLQNRENIVEQVQKCAEYISAFTYEISCHFKKTYLNGVAGNHSRLGFKDSVLRDERLDNLIPWYMKAKLSHLNNIEFLDDYNYDASIGRIYVRGHEYWCVHGDYDRFSESGLSKLVLMLGSKPTALLSGHMHHNSYDSISDVALIRSGCFCGTADDYTVSKRISGKPSQMVCLVDENGIKGLFPITFGRE